MNKALDGFIKSLENSGGYIADPLTPPAKNGAQEMLVCCSFGWAIDLLLKGTAEIPPYQRLDCWKDPHRIRYTKDIYHAALDGAFMSKPTLGLSIRTDNTISLFDGAHSSRSMLIYTCQTAQAIKRGIVESRSLIKDWQYNLGDDGILPWSKLNQDQRDKILATPIRIQVLVNADIDVEGLEYARKNSGTTASSWDVEWSFGYEYQKSVDSILNRNPCFKHPVFGHNVNRRISGIIATMLLIMDPESKIKSGNIKEVMTKLEKYKDEKPTKYLLDDLYDFFEFCDGVYNRGGIKGFVKSTALNVLYPMYKISKPYAPERNVYELAKKWFLEELPAMEKSGATVAAKTKKSPGVGVGIKMVAYQKLVEERFTKFLKDYTVPASKKGSIDKRGENPKVYKTK
jgi:hypothetical protein